MRVKHSPVRSHIYLHRCYSHRKIWRSTTYAPIWDRPEYITWTPEEPMEWVMQQGELTLQERVDYTHLATVLFDSYIKDGHTPAWSKAETYFHLKQEFPDVHYMEFILICSSVEFMELFHNAEDHYYRTFYLERTEAWKQINNR